MIGRPRQILQKANSIVIITCSLLTFMMLSFGVATADDADLPMKGRLIGNGWAWQEGRLGPIASARLSPSECRFTLQLDGGEKYFRVSVASDWSEEVIEFKAHADTTWVVVGKVLLLADYEPDSSGGEIKSISLVTGQELWSSPLLALGDVSHSAYQSRVILIADDADYLYIYGDESQGCYKEVKRIDNGKTVDHRIFECDTTHE